MNTSTGNYLDITVADSAPTARAQFIRKTYAHLAGAILLFVALEYLLINSPLAEPLLKTMIGGRFSWLIVLGLFIGVSNLANWWAMSDTSVGKQYLGLGLYVVAETIIFLPLLAIANLYYEGIIWQAGVMTLVLFAGLTVSVFVTRSDFRFLGPILSISGLVALGVIVLSLLFGFQLGFIFSAAMVIFASVAILYNTSKVMLNYRTDQHVAASLTLFASVALLFWYILRIFMRLSRR